MKRKDQELIERFIQRVLKEIASIETIILFGSMARDDYDRRSDIDIMLVIREDKPDKYSELISKIITELQPHREIRTVLTNLRDYDEDYYRNVFSDGKVLFGKAVITPEHLALKPYLLISYDLAGKPNTLQVKISKKVHGYKSKKVIKGKKKIYEYPGLKNVEGGEIVSKSAILLPMEKSKDLIEIFKRLNVPHKLFKIWR
ncbi:MAG: nucleotidyltransferase domain-containing protein [Thermoplasmata archaeon]|nr:MAG: nucleotidyltransferase domain-containing protein [Thermoplasmata archaeon]